MPKLTLYHAAPSRSSTVRWLLEELAEPYEVRLLSLRKGDTARPKFLALNPMGKVPVLTHGEMVMSEAAAICTYLADAFPAAKLNVPIGDAHRGAYLKWLFFGPSCLEPAMLERAYPRRETPPRAALGFGDFATVVTTLTGATAAARPYLLGSQFTAADVVIGSGVSWGMRFKLLPERPEFATYVGRLGERPAFQRAAQQDASLQKQQDGG